MCIDFYTNIKLNYFSGLFNPVRKNFHGQSD
jgi:hypothetical protein